MAITRPICLVQVMTQVIYTIYNPGNTMALHFDGDFSQTGFQLAYFQVDPGEDNSVIPLMCPLHMT